MNTEQAAAYTIKQFCSRYAISTALYFKIQKQGRGPRTRRVGRKILISAEAASQWFEAIETLPAGEAKAARRRGAKLSGD